MGGGQAKGFSAMHAFSHARPPEHVRYGSDNFQPPGLRIGACKGTLGHSRTLVLKARSDTTSAFLMLRASLSSLRP